MPFRAALKLLHRREHTICCGEASRLIKLRGLAGAFGVDAELSDREAITPAKGAQLVWPGRSLSGVVRSCSEFAPWLRFLSTLAVALELAGGFGVALGAGKGIQAGRDGHQAGDQQRHNVG